MTSLETPPQSGRSVGQSAAPEVAWPERISQEDALKWVRRRLPGARQVNAGLYHHPMLGVAFQWRRPFAESMLAHAIVDLVGGRAYAAEPWDDVAFVSIGEVDISLDLRPPERVIADDAARFAARRLVNSVLLRRRKLDFAGRLVEHAAPVLFGKPNWWVRGVYENRNFEIVIDGLNGNHYVFAA